MPARLGAVLCVVVAAVSLPAYAQTINPVPTNDPPHACRVNLPESERGKSVLPTMVQFTITVDGTVKDVSVIASGNLPAVDEAAIRCVSKWHYVPAAKDGTPIEQPGWQARVLWKALN